MSRRRQRHGFKWRSLYQWHRTIGLVAALFVIVLAVTGIALNHTQRLELADRYVSSPALLDWYGIKAPDPVSFRVAGHRVTQLGKRLYFNDELVSAQSGKLIGAVESGGLIVVALSGELLLLTSEGRRVESLGDAQGVPAGMRRIGAGEAGRIVLRAAHGDYTTDIDELAWSEFPELPAEWSEPAAMPGDLYAELSAAWRGAGLSVERMLLDLHTGRIAGPWGVWVMDAAAVLLLVLAFSGVILWINQKRKERQHRKADHGH